MAAKDDIRFHAGRAQAERQRAREAASVPAARAHLALSELHDQRARELGGDREAVPAAEAGAPRLAMAPGS